MTNSSANSRNSKKPRTLRFDDFPRFSANEKILLLDLDETLVHCRPEPFSYPTLAARLTQGTQQIVFYISQRPGVEAFLKKMSKLYTIILFTSSIKEYAEGVLKALKIDSYFAKVLHRGHCSLNSEKKYIKNICILGELLKNTVLVDDCPINGEFQPNNLLLSKAFKGDLDDNELENIGFFLEELAKKSDVRPVNDHFIDFELKLETDRELVSPKVMSKEADIKFMEKLKTMQKEEKYNAETECEFEGVDECVIDTPTRFEVQQFKMLSLKTTSMSVVKTARLSDQETMKPSLENVAFDVKIFDDQIRDLDSVTERINQIRLIERLPTLAPKSQYLKMTNKCSAV